MGKVSWERSTGKEDQKFFSGYSSSIVEVMGWGEDTCGSCSSMALYPITFGKGDVHICVPVHSSKHLRQGK